MASAACACRHVQASSASTIGSTTSSAMASLLPEREGILGLHNFERADTDILFRHFAKASNAEELLEMPAGAACLRPVASRSQPCLQSSGCAGVIQRHRRCLSPRQGAHTGKAAARRGWKRPWAVQAPRGGLMPDLPAGVPVKKSPPACKPVRRAISTPGGGRVVRIAACCSKASRRSPDTAPGGGGGFARQAGRCARGNQGPKIDAPAAAIEEGSWVNGPKQRPAQDREDGEGDVYRRDQTRGPRDGFGVG